MSNNPRLYNAVMIGATGGILTRWITSETNGSYADILAVVQAIAEQVDSQLESAFVSDAQCTLMQSIAQSIFNDRYPQFENTAAYETISRAIATAYLELTEGIDNNTVQVRFIGLDSAANALPKTLLETGHLPGVYSVSRMSVIRVAASAGNYTENLGCNGPDGVNVAAGWGSFSATTVRQVGAQSTALVTTLGTAPLTTVAVNTGITGNYLIDTTYTMTWVGPVPSP